jgi:peptidoglycan/LPS O-acetylase OafA/YrhL
VTPFWYAIVALACLAGIINFALAAARRKRATTALVRVVAGSISLILAIGILYGKAIASWHPPVPLTKENVFIAFGVFVAIVFFVPSYIERATGDQPKVSMQERAARPVNATVRLRDARAGDEWVN